MHVFVKQSGNLISEPLCKGTVSDVADLLEHLGGEGGVTLLPGGGDGGRGREMVAHGTSKQTADSVGRLATLTNALLLADTLQQGGLPNRILLAPTMRYRDDRGIGEIKAYSPKAVMDCHKSGMPAIIAGGTGENEWTTDAAVVRLAQLFKTAYPDRHVRALKATTFDGVFDRDPSRYPKATRYSHISADVMLGDFGRLGAMDPISLALIRDHPVDVGMLVYSPEHHTLVEAIRDTGFGTLVLHGTGIMRPAA